MRLKILFVIPPYYSFNYFVPDGIGIIATMAKQSGFDVQVLLAEAGERVLTYNNRVVETIRNEQINVVAIGGMSPSYRNIEKLISLCKTEGCTTILGGYIVESALEVVAANIGADFCIYGEGEYTFLELADALENDKDVSGIRGLIYMLHSEIVINPPRDVVKDLDSLPFVDGDLVHYDRSLEMNPTFYMILSRSCPYQCTFCYHIKGAYYRAQSLDYVFRKLDNYIDKYGDKIKSLFIGDEMFNVEKDRVLEFCKRIKKYNLPFLIQSRVDAMDEESLIALKEAGAYMVAYGLESASNKVLSSMKKNLTIEKIKEVFDFTEKHGLQIQANLIIGDIEDNFDTIRESEKFFDEYSKKYDINITLIQVLPGTHLYKYALEKGIITDELAFMKEGCPFINVSKLPDEVYYTLADKYKGFQDSRNIISRRPLEKDYLELDIHRNGYVTYICYCPNCSSKIVMENIYWRDGGIVYRFFGCPACSKRIELRLSKFFSFDPTSSFLINNLAEAFFRPYAGKRIAIWGITRPIQRLILESQTLRDALVKVVDIRYQQLTHETYCGLSVEKPESLKEISFDYLIIAAVERRGEVANSLNSMNLNPSIIEIDNVLR